MWSMLAVRNGRDGSTGVGRAPGQMDVGRVVGADRGRDRRIVEEPLAKGQRVVRAGRHQHDVDQARPRDQPHLVAIFFERLEPDFAGVHLGRRPGAPRPSAMSASLASAMMNSRQLGSAWIAASLRSSDFSMASALPLPCPEIGDARAARRVAIAAAGAHRHPDRARCRARIGRDFRRRPTAPACRLGLAGRLGIALVDRFDRFAQDLGRMLERRDFLGPELDLELAFDALCGRPRWESRCRRRGCRRDR